MDTSRLTHKTLFPRLITIDSKSVPVDQVPVDREKRVTLEKEGNARTRRNLSAERGIEGINAYRSVCRAQASGVLRRARAECCGWAGVGTGGLGLDRVRVDWEQG